MITIAPELNNSLGIIEYLSANKVIAAVGHSDGDYDDALQAVDAGASLVTHFSNGMSKLKDGNRTFATALLYKSEIPLEIIFDRQHVSDEDLQTIFEIAPNRIVLVTDAMAAAGKPDGLYQIGTLEVVVKDGTARLSSNGALAGSTLSMDLVVENAKTYGLPNSFIDNSTRTLPLSLLNL